MDREIEDLFKRLHGVCDTKHMKDLDIETYNKWILFKLEMNNFCDKIVFDCMKRNGCV